MFRENDGVEPVLFECRGAEVVSDHGVNKVAAAIYTSRNGCGRVVQCPVVGRSDGRCNKNEFGGAKDCTFAEPPIQE